MEITEYLTKATTSYNLQLFKVNPIQIVVTLFMIRLKN